MRAYENAKDLILLSLSLATNHAYFNLWPESPDSLALLAFVSFSPFFAFLFRNISRQLGYLAIVSCTYFLFMGISITSHFGIDARYGICVGLLECFVQLLVVGLWKKNQSTVDSGLLCLLWLTWVSVDYVVALFYGIAFLPPIQLYRYPFIIQPVALFGFSLIDAFVIGINILVGIIVASVMGNRTCVPKTYKNYAVLLAVSVLGWVLLCSSMYADRDFGNAPSVKLSTISPGKKFSGDLDDIIDLTSRASKIDGSQFIVWPELYINPRHTSNRSCEDFIEQDILPRLREIDSYVVIGCDEHIDNKDCPFGNLAFTVSPKGSSIIGSYGKQHPVTMIGEKSCVRNGYRSYKLDEGPIVNGMDVPTGLTFSTLICYDMDFADAAAHVSDNGAHFILNASEDWTAARGHFAASVFRAVENRVSVAKSDWGWDSVIIDPFGNMRAFFATQEEHRQILSSEVPIISDRIGWYFLRQNVFSWLSLLIISMFLMTNTIRWILAKNQAEVSDIEARLVGSSS